MSKLRTILWLAILSAIAVVSRPAVAVTGSPFVAPSNPIQAIHGLKLHVDPTWVAANGYR
jgi:hypothetical protein